MRVLDRTRIRPRVVQDGGDIQFDAWFTETGEVVVRMIGACEDCPSSTLTLKQGVERMMMHYIPEVKRVLNKGDDASAQPARDGDPSTQQCPVKRSSAGSPASTGSQHDRAGDPKLAGQARNPLFEPYRILCGVAIGYSDPDFPANALLVV